MSDFSQWHQPSPHQINKAANVLEAGARAEEELADLVFGCHSDPLKFVMMAYPWGEPGSLERYKGPDTWQKEVLIELGEEIRKRKFDGVNAVDPIRITVASGHGIGKGVMTAFLENYLSSTRPYSIGTVTANTYGQLETKTWAAIQKWSKLCLTSHWFTVTGNIKFKNEFREQWFTAALSCAEENAQAFAGQHNANSTSFYIVDEGSNVPDAIYNVADGGLTDGEPMIFVFGNPTRRQGKFFRINFGTERHRWIHRSVDSRTCAFTNKKLLKEWEDDWGTDSDRFRVQVKGLPPSASDLQFISTSIVGEAQRRTPTVLRNDPLICGLDIARGGADNCVFRFRRGLDGKSIPPIIVSGEDSRNSTVIENKALDILRNGVLIPEQTGDNPFGITEGYGRDERRLPITMMFIDGTGVGGPVCDHIKNLGFEKQVTEIQFSWESPNTAGYEECANMRSWMWELMKKWLERGAIDDSSDLESDLTAPMYHYNAKNQLVLEAKEAIKKRLGGSRGNDPDKMDGGGRSGSPDNADALALTFARPVAPRKKGRADDEYEFDDEGEFDYMNDSGGSSKGRVWG